MQELGLTGTFFHREVHKALNNNTSENILYHIFVFAQCRTQLNFEFKAAAKSYFLKLPYKSCVLIGKVFVQNGILTEPQQIAPNMVLCFVLACLTKSLATILVPCVLF